MKAPMDESRDPRPVTRITKMIIGTPMSWYITTKYSFHFPDKRADIGNLKPCLGMGTGPQSLKSVLVFQPQKAKTAKNTYLLTPKAFFRPPAHLTFLKCLWSSNHGCCGWLFQGLGEGPSECSIAGSQNTAPLSTFRWWTGVTSHLYKGIYTECPGAQAKSPVASTPCVWKNVFLVVSY